MYTRIRKPKSRLEAKLYNAWKRPKGVTGEWKYRRLIRAGDTFWPIDRWPAKWSQPFYAGAGRKRTRKERFDLAKAWYINGMDPVDALERTLWYVDQNGRWTRYRADKWIADALKELRSEKWLNSWAKYIFVIN